MFARVKKSRGADYLQVVESYRDQGRVRQRVVMYVGHYASVAEALERMPKDLRYLRTSATKAEKVAASFPDERHREDAERTRRRADDLAGKLDALRRLVDEHPDLLERDRERAERHARRQREAMAERMAARIARAGNL